MGARRGGWPAALTVTLTGVPTLLKSGDPGGTGAVLVPFKVGKVNGVGGSSRKSMDPRLDSGESGFTEDGMAAPEIAWISSIESVVTEFLDRVRKRGGLLVTPLGPAPSQSQGPGFTFREDGSRGGLGVRLLRVSRCIIDEEPGWDNVGVLPDGDDAGEVLGVETDSEGVELNCEADEEAARDMDGELGVGEVSEVCEDVENFE